MASQPGAKLLLQVGDGASPEHFTTLGGMTLTHLTLSNPPHAADTLASGSWRTLASGAGLRAVTVGVEGRFTNTAAEATLRGYALAGSVNDYKLLFPNGDTLSAPFLVTAYARAGAQHDAETYAITLESAGAAILCACVTRYCFSGSSRARK